MRTVSLSIELAFAMFVAGVEAAIAIDMYPSYADPKIHSKLSSQQPLSWNLFKKPPAHFLHPSFTHLLCLSLHSFLFPSAIAAFSALLPCLLSFHHSKEHVSLLPSDCFCPCT